MKLRERARIAGVMDVKTSCLFFGLCGKPLLRRFAGAPARRSGLAPNLENLHSGLIPKGPKFGDRKMAIFGDLDETFVSKSANLGGVQCF